MSNVARDIKKSQFLQEDTIPPGATFDFVFNGTNYKVSIEDMILAFGALGTLSQLGDPAQTPILKKTGPDNQIRNLEDGPGVKASISTAGGAKLSHNFSIGDAGQAILINPTASSPVIRNLVAGDGISIAGEGKNLRVTATGETPVALNVIIVNEMSDFPAAVDGARTLGDDSAYLVSAKLSTSNRFILGLNTLLYGADSSVASLEYTGTGTMLTAVDKKSKVTLLSLSAPNGQLLDISATAPDNGAVFQLVNVSVPICKSIGSLNNLTAVQITDAAFSDITTGGLDFAGSINIFLGTRNIMRINAGTLFDFGTVVFTQGFALETSFVAVAAGATLIDGLPDSGNIGPEALGVFINNRADNDGTILNNISQKDARWSFLLNDETPDSINSLLATNSGNTVVIATINTPVIIGATWLSSHESRFEGTSGGRFTYIGKGAHVSISATITAELDGTPTDRDCTFYVFKNGVEVTESGIKRSMSTGDPGNLSLVWQEDLATGDYLELFAENNESTENIIINNAILGISG